MDLIERAFRLVRREDFLPDEEKEYAHIDAPLPIGYGQTNSQPTTVERMLRWLEPEKGNKVLDVGSGSGWTTALLANIVGPKGWVYSVEAVPELVEFGKNNCRFAGVKNVSFHQAMEIFGLPEFAPYNRILVSAAGKEVPPELIDQLKEGGKIVIPVKDNVLEIEKQSGNLDINIHSGYAFVPLISLLRGR